LGNQTAWQVNVPNSQSSRSERRFSRAFHYFKRLRPLTALVLTLILLVAMGLFLRRESNQKLTFQDLSIDHWFTQLPLTFVQTNNLVFFSQAMSIATQRQTYGTTNKDNLSQVYAAFDSFGTNAIPYLLRKLQQDDSVARKQLARLAMKLGVRCIPFRAASAERAQAVTGLIRIKEQLPSSTLQVLSNLSVNSKAEIGCAASPSAGVHCGPSQGRWRGPAFGRGAVGPCFGWEEE